MSESKQELLEKEKTQGTAVTLKESLMKRMPQIQTLLPKHMTTERFMRVVFMSIQKNPDLGNCTQESLIASMLKCAEWGLLPDGRQGALIPFNNKIKTAEGKEVWQKEATFLPMYLGLMDLSRRSGLIADIFPATIYQNDEFYYELGLNKTLIHKPRLDGDRGKAIAYYAVIELKDGTKTFGPGPMTVAEVDKIRQRSKSPNSPAWRNDFDAMGWKTVLKRNLKFGPQSTELADAIDHDNEQDFNTVDLGVINPQNSADDLNKELLEAPKARKESATEVSATANQATTDNKPKFTFAQIADMINKSKNDDELDVALDLSNNLTELHKNELINMANKKQRDAFK